MHLVLALGALVLVVAMFGGWAILSRRYQHSLGRVWGQGWAARNRRSSVVVAVGAVVACLYVAVRLIWDAVS